MLGGAETGAAEQRGDGHEELRRRVVGVDDIVVAHDTCQLDDIQRVVIAVTESPDVYAGVLVPQPPHQGRFLTVEDAHVDGVAHGAQPWHEVDDEGLGPAGV